MAFLMCKDIFDNACTVHRPGFWLRSVEIWAVPRVTVAFLSRLALCFSPHNRARMSQCFRVPLSGLPALTHSCASHAI
jgi:hypothetical protein